jgi:hypothetical protein
MCADVSVEQVAALASQNTLPEPSLHLDSLPSSTSNVAALHFSRRNSVPAARPPVPAHAPSYSSEDPWNTARFASTSSNGAAAGISVAAGSSVVTGTGLPKDWWKRQSKVEVNLIGQQGFILNRYTVYEITSEVSCSTSVSVFRCLIFFFLHLHYLLFLLVSVGILFRGDTRNLCIYGIVWFDGILFDYFLRYHQNV